MSRQPTAYTNHRRPQMETTKKKRVIKKKPTVWIDVVCQCCGVDFVQSEVTYKRKKLWGNTGTHCKPCNTKLNLYFTVCSH